MCSCHSDRNLYGGLVTCPGCKHRSFDTVAMACERRRCGYVATKPVFHGKHDGETA